MPGAHPGRPELGAGAQVWPHRRRLRHGAVSRASHRQHWSTHGLEWALCLLYLWEEVGCCMACRHSREVWLF